MKKSMIVAFYLLIIFGCSDPESDPKPIAEESKNQKDAIEISTLTTFLLGQVSINGKNIALSESTKGDQTVQVDQNALLDLQVLGFDSKILLRSKTRSEFKLYGRTNSGNKQLNVFVKKGEVLFSIQALKKGEEVVVYSPLSKTRVVGTQFKVIVKEDATTSIKVGEGKVQVTQSSPALEVLSNSDSLSIEQKTKIETILGDNTVIESGKEIQLSRNKVKEALADPELIQLLESPTLKKIDNLVDTPVDIELKKELALLENKLGALTVQTTPPMKLNLETKQTNAIEIVKEAKQIVNIDKIDPKNQESIQAEVKNAIKVNSPELLDTMSKVLGKKTETLILKNGQTLSGLVYQSGTKIVVKTPTESKTFNESEIAGFRF